MTTKIKMADMENEDLFCKDKLENLFIKIRKNVKKDIKYYNVHRQLKDNEDEIAERILMRYRINPPHLHENDIYQISENDVEIPFEKIRNGHAQNDLDPGETCTFVIPFSGDFELFYLQPEKDSQLNSVGVVTKNRLLISFKADDQNLTSSLLLESFHKNLGTAKETLHCIQEDAKQFNELLAEFIHNEIDQIKQISHTESSMVA